jgi:hypothetical protein
VTRERIRQIEAKALRKLRHPARAGNCAIIWEIDEFQETVTFEGDCLFFVGVGFLL